MADNGRLDGDQAGGDDALILALAAGSTVRDAAERAGVGERTVYRRLDDAAFRRRVTRARNRVFEQAIGRLTDASASAADTMRSLLSAESEAVRLAAAKSIIEISAKLREIGELTRRLDELEQIVGVPRKPDQEKCA
ncbi:MAG TPA: hypothetical protein VMV69_01580 [Pirellulales bacterium]|nr:hypothetical protein [Pirellulales bacterium]